MEENSIELNLLRARCRHNFWAAARIRYKISRDMLLLVNGLLSNMQVNNVI
jgi:hypothetical protein